MKTSQWFGLALACTLVSVLGCGGDDDKAVLQASGTVTDAIRDLPLEGAVIEIKRKECIKPNWLSSCSHSMTSTVTGSDGTYSLLFEYPSAGQTPDTATFSYPNEHGHLYEVFTHSFDGDFQVLLDVKLAPKETNSPVIIASAEAISRTTDVEIKWDMESKQWFDDVIIARGTEEKLLVEPVWGTTYPVGSSIGSYEIVYAGPFAPLFVGSGMYSDNYRFVDQTGLNETLLYYTMWGTDAYEIHSKRSNAGPVWTKDIEAPGPVTNVKHNWNSLTQVFELSWTNPSDPDLWGIWILRSTEGPVDGLLEPGKQYMLHDAVGNAEVWRLGDIANQSTTGADFASGTTVYFRLFAADDDENYAPPIDYDVALD
ncbi:MAG: hypothetical protein IPM54_22795 [Polyangiaceae bacterium]|nr:hypothetical protein [Polyangiaceae bacterium]